jgi:zinc D-Ala-D-Ala carboxypeptidase
MKTMTDADWLSVAKYFKREEFDSPDAPLSGNNMSIDFIKFLYSMRSALNFPFVIPQGGGYRTTAYQVAKGGTVGSDSDHTQGVGVDIECTDSHNRFLLIYYCIAHGIKRLEVCDKHIHVGCSVSLPQEVFVWGISK